LVKKFSFFFFFQTSLDKNRLWYESGYNLIRSQKVLFFTPYGSSETTLKKQKKGTAEKRKTDRVNSHSQKNTFEVHRRVTLAYHPAVNGHHSPSTVAVGAATRSVEARTLKSVLHFFPSVLDFSERVVVLVIFSLL